MAFGSIRTFHTHFRDMTAARRFSGSALEELAKAKIIGVRAGTEHRYTGVWVVVVEGRVFVRSWNDKPTGWYRADSGETEGLATHSSRVSMRLSGRRLREGRRRISAGMKH
jgi:hypothetical protein